MGFASGFRTGLAAGERRSNMPIVQGLGSMIDRIEARNKGGGSRVARGGGGPSSYDKYTARKDKEEAAAEEKRRYNDQQQQLKQREAAETKLATEERAAGEEQAAVQAQQEQESHASKMASEAQQRQQAQKLVERSDKKEKRIESYRALLQGIAARNKALTEEAFAALSPDMPKGKDADEIAEIKREMVAFTDPQTGEVTQHRKFTVGRDKTGAESEKAMPAPAIDFNDDGSITVEFPTADGVGNPETYANVDEFLELAGIKHMNPEFETGEDAEKATDRTRKAELHELKMIAAEQTRIDKMIANEGDPDITDPLQAKLDKRRQKVTGGVEGKKEKAVASYKDKQGNEVYAGSDRPKGYADKDIKQHPKTKAWYEKDPDTGKYSKPILSTRIAAR